MPLSVSDDSGLGYGRERFVDETHPLSTVINYYAMMGLEAYNDLTYSKFELDGVEKFQCRSYTAGAYKIFLKARMDQGDAKRFRVLVDHRHNGVKLDLGFPLARQVKENGTFLEPIPKECDEMSKSICKMKLPDWPTERVLNDNKVQESEFDDHKISLYLKMVYCAHNRLATNEKLTGLTIVKVAIESESHYGITLKVFYIEFQEVDKRTGEFLERKAVVSRFINKRTGYLTLTGRCLTGEEASPDEKPSSSGNTSPKESIRKRSWRKLAESDGFDMEDESISHRAIGMTSASNPDWLTEDKKPKLHLYAKAGLHRYNTLKGTRLELSAIRKYNRTMNCVASYYITLAARDGGTAAGSKEEIFQVRVDEKSYGDLDMTVSVARPKDEIDTKNKMPFRSHFHADGVRDPFYKGKLPRWPSSNDLKNPKRFYVVKDSELQDKDNDWIRLYLELAVCVDDNGWTKMTDLAKLQITQVAIETIEDIQPSSLRLKSKSANVYITYNGWVKEKSAKAGLSEGKAIIRRVLNGDTGYLTLLGRVTCSKKRLRRGVDALS